MIPTGGTNNENYMKIPFAQYFIRQALDAKVNPKPKAEPKPEKIYPHSSTRQQERQKKKWLSMNLQKKNS